MLIKMSIRNIFPHLPKDLMLHYLSNGYAGCEYNNKYCFETTSVHLKSS